MNPTVTTQGYVCCEHDYAAHMRTIGRPRWRSLLDPRDPDSEEPEDDETQRLRDEDASEEHYIDSQAGQAELADAVAAEDYWLRGRGY